MSRFCPKWMWLDWWKTNFIKCVSLRSTFSVIRASGFWCSVCFCYMNIHLLKNRRLNKTNIFYSSENKARWDLTAQGQFCPRRPALILSTSNGWGSDDGKEGLGDLRCLCPGIWQGLRLELGWPRIRTRSGAGMSTGCVSLLGLPTQNSTDLSGINNRNSFSHSSGWWSLRCQQGWLPCPVASLLGSQTSVLYRLFISFISASYKNTSQMLGSGPTLTASF